VPSRGDTPGLPAPPPLIFIAGLLVGGVLEAIFPTDSPAWWVRGLVGVVGLGGAYLLAGRALRSFATVDTSPNPFEPTTAIATDGPYRFTRNPMYLGMTLAYIGLTFAIGILWALAVLPVVLLIIDRLVIAREERYLEARFGDEYRAYKRRVRRWL
jgi:protein-S-isoprenylcysteine O-methyltransferase Ste14